MTQEQAQKVLDELQEVSPEKLNNEAKKLFEAIMKIADERDSLKIKVVNQQERIDYLMRSIERKEQSLIEEHEENIECYTNIEEKDKIIDLMANHIATSDSDLCEYLDITTKCKYYAGDNGKTCDNCIKQYFINKAKEIR